MPARVSIGGALSGRGIPQFPFTDEQTKAVYAFVANSGWDAYEVQERDE